jgi:hypothetical protein
MLANSLVRIAWTSYDRGLLNFIIGCERSEAAFVVLVAGISKMY